MNAPPSRPPYLFYSPRCSHCQQLIEMIKKNQSLAKKIEPINVHIAKNLPPQLDAVPAILFGGQLLVGPDTFKWVQFQTPQRDDRDRQQGGMPGGGMPGGGMPGGGMPGGGGNIPGMQGHQQEEIGIPMPSDISSDTKHGIDFTPLPGQESVNIDPTIPRFSFLPGEGNQSDGTVGIDYVAAMDQNMMKSNKSEGMDRQMKDIQELRGNDSQRMQGQMGQQGPGFGAPMGGMNNQMQQGYNQGMGQQAYIAPMQGQQGYDRIQGQGQGQEQNPYELQTGSRGGYSTQYQQQNNQYKRGDDLPKRW
jgi:hypothetical protein